MTQTNDLRATARTLFDAAVTAADPALAVRRQLARMPLPQSAGRTVLIAVGKAAPAMLAEALKHVTGPHEALAVTHHENTQKVPGARVLNAGHPVPDAAGAAAGQAVMELLDSCGAEDQVIALISGGGSALLPAPVPGLSLADKAAVSQVLLSGGLDIVTMNLVRQQLSQLKGGGFLRRAAPAPVTALILSDVIGDDLRAIASGPTVSPIGTVEEARAILKNHGLWDRLPAAARDALDHPRPPEPVPAAVNVMIGSNGQSVDAMADAARAAGWDVRVSDRPLVGDVDSAAQEVLALMAPVDRPTALLFGGETTVILRGSGRGGRNQELALRVALAAPDLAQDWLFLSGGTDGRDGPTDAAGGVVDAGSAARIAAAGQDAQKLLANNDSYAALKAADDLLMTGATGTNVADVQVLLIRP
ncbi:glycerate kinase type-2 family protein [Puniceibacterium confluentis]|uniref:glycerate kinase type-2 family protein n=1 Tax=Puniceibacterium confluentis TaxID=1958944 RepID=UPI00356953B6